ncbi:MAG: helix-turn-helix transcriptional regulator [Terriglobia bacterium]|jgi:transcriptional regulator with XRE-family HTH domain
MSIGTRIIQLRDQMGMTQRDLSERTGLAGSYLSRIENRHLEPRPRTLRKIAAALGVPMSDLFQERPAKLGTLRCLITNSGTCVADSLRSSRGKPADPHTEQYSPRQLQLLRMANYLIQTADARLLDSLEVLLGALLNAERHKALGREESALPMAGETF